jgi:type II secretory ATPase GspE/PulE/Tfp pilus assembly ATPase PilB-like protein
VTDDSRNGDRPPALTLSAPSPRQPKAVSFRLGQPPPAPNSAARRPPRDRASASNRHRRLDPKVDGWPWGVRLDHAEHRRPQDGRWLRERPGKPKIDLRIKEDFSLRLLIRDAHLLDIDSLGLLDQEHEQLLELLHSPSGLILVTGPTLGAQPHFLGASLRGVLAQQLVRTLCLECKRSYGLSAAASRPGAAPATAADAGPAPPGPVLPQIEIFRRPNRRQDNRCKECRHE